MSKLSCTKTREASEKFELQKLQAEASALSNTNALTAGQVTKKYDVKKLIQPFNSKNDMDLNLFERQIARAGVPVENYVLHLPSCMLLDVVNLVTRESLMRSQIITTMSRRFCRRDSTH